MNRVLARVVVLVIMLFGLACANQRIEPLFSPGIYQSDKANSSRIHKEYKWPISLTAPNEYCYDLPTLPEGIASVSIIVSGSASDVVHSEQVKVRLEVFNETDRLIIKSKKRLGSESPMMMFSGNDRVLDYFFNCNRTILESSDKVIEYNDNSITTRSMPSSRAFAESVPRCPDCSCRWEWRTRNKALYKVRLTVISGRRELANCKAELEVLVNSQE